MCSDTPPLASVAAPPLAHEAPDNALYKADHNYGHVAITGNINMKLFL